MGKISVVRFVSHELFVLFSLLTLISIVSGEKCVQLLHESEEFRYSAGMYDVDTITPSLCQALCRDGNFSYAAVMDTMYCLCSYTNYDYPELDGQKCCNSPPEDCGADNKTVLAMEVDDIPGVEAQLMVEVNYEEEKVVLKYYFNVRTNTMANIYLFYDGQQVADAISSEGESELNMTYDFKEANIPGLHEAKIIATDEATNFFSSSDSQEIWIPDERVSLNLECPDFAETEENITCIVSILRGTDLTLEFDLGDGEVEEFFVPDSAKFPIGLEIPFIPKDDSSYSEVPETVQLGLVAIPTSMLIAFELFANVSGKFDIQILSPTCSDGKIYCGNCKDSCEEKGVVECSDDEAFWPTNLACGTSDPPASSGYSIDETEEIKSFTIEVESGYIYHSLEETDYVQLESGYIFLLKRVEENVVKYVDATESEIEAGYSDIDEDGNSLSVRHLLRPVVIMPTEISFNYNYTKAGKYKIKAKISSDFSDDLKDEKEIKILIVEPLSGLKLLGPSNCTDVGTSATLEASVDTGMNVTFVWEAEGYEERRYTLEEPPKLVEEQYSCMSEGNFTVNLEATDQLRTENASVSVCCINHVSRNWALTTDSPKITPPGTITIEFLFTGNDSYFPIEAAADIDFGDGEIEESISIKDDDKKISREHSYDKGNSYNITVRAYNKFDEELFIEQVDIFDKLGELGVFSTYVMEEDGPESPLHGPDKTDVPVNAFVNFNASITGSVEHFKMVLENEEVEQDKENNIFQYKFETVGEYAATFTAYNPLEASNNVTLQLRVMETPVGLGLEASPSSLMPDEEVAFTLQYESVDQFTCIAFDAGDGDTVETFGCEETCEAVMEGSETHFNARSEERRKRREAQEVAYIEENKISIKYVYRSGGLFEPTAKAFNTIFETNATTLVNVTYPPSSIWIENNSTNVRRPMKFFRKETFRLETTALLFDRPGRDYVMRWEVDQITSAQEVVKNIDISSIRSAECSAIRFPPRFLEVGLYHIKYFIDIVGNETVEETLSCFTFLEIMKSELLPMIIKGGASYILRGLKQMVYLEAGIYSEDPDDPEDKDFEMSWSCRFFDVTSLLSEGEEYDSELSLSEKSITSAQLENLTPNEECFKKEKRAQDFKGRDFNFDTDELRNLSILYEFQVTVSKDTRKETSIIFLDVIENIPPGIILMCEKSVACEVIPNGGFLVNPNNWLAIRAECVSDCGKGDIQYEWDIYGVEEESQELVVLEEWKNYAIIDEDRLGINKTFFESNPNIKSYHIGVKGTDTQKKRPKGSAKLYIKLNNPPTPGSCKISESSGLAMIDTFSLDFKGWTDVDGHELKDFSVYSIHRGKKYHLHYGMKTSVEFKLPPGESEIICTVEDRMGAVTEKAVGTITADLPDKEKMEEWQSTVNFKFFFVEGKISLMTQALASEALSDEMVREDGHSSIAAEVEQIWNAYKDLEGIDTSYFTKEAREEIEAQVRDRKSEDKETEAEKNFEKLESLDIIPFEVLEDAEVYGQAISTLAETRPLNKESKKLVKDFVEDMADSIFTMEVPHPSDRDIANRLLANTMNSLSETISGEMIGGNFLDSELEEAYDLLSYNITQPNFFILFVNGSRWDVEEKVHQKKVEGAKNLTQEDVHDQVEVLKNITDRMKTSIAQDLMVGENPLVVDTTSGFQLTVEKRHADEVSGETMQNEGTSITLPSSCVLLGKEPNCKESGAVGLVAVKWSSILEPEGTEDVNLSAESSTLDFSITNRDGNDTLNIKDAAEPFEVCLSISPPPEDDRGGKLRHVQPSFDEKDEFLVYHQLTIDKAGAAVKVDFVPDDDEGRAFVFFYGVGYKPSLLVYDGRVFLKKMDRESSTYSMLFSADSEPGEDFFFAVGHLTDDSVKKKATFKEDKNLSRNDMTNEFSTGYSIALFTTGCYFYSEEKSVWSSDGCKVKSVQSNMICCLCNHLTMFGSGFLIAPNKIEFSYIFANAGFKDNLIIYLTLIFSLLVYILLLIWARWKDRKDLSKLGATPLADNSIQDKYVYDILIQTGFQYNAGTKSKVHFILSGEEDETEVRTLTDDKREIFQRGSINSFVMTVPRCLGQLNYLRIWHDNSGAGKKASWFLQHVVVKDVMTGYKYEFIAERWFAVEEGDKLIDHLIPVAGREQTTQFSHLFPSASRRNLADNHLWLSVFTRPPRSRFSRVQRLSCCVAIFYLSMLTSAMWYETTPEQPSTGAFRFGPLSLSPEQIAVGLMSNLIVFPPSFLMIILFRKSRARDLRPSHVNVALEHQYEKWRKEYALPKMQRKNSKPQKRLDVEAYGRPAKKKCLLPWWCTYIAWFLVIVSVGASIFFLWAYGLQFGNIRTRKWLTSLVISFFSSVLLTEPLKIFCLSLVMACLCGNPDVDDDDLDDDEEDPHLRPDEEWLHNVNPAVTVKRPKYHPINPESLEAARKIRENEVQMYALFKEICAYAFYLWVLIILSYGNRDPNSFFIRETTINNFIKPGDLWHDFHYVNTEVKFWNWTKNALLPELFAGLWYNGRVPLGLRLLVDDRSNFKIGYPVLRQVRASTDSCTVPMEMTLVMDECAGFGNMVNEDGRIYSKSWGHNITMQSRIPPEYKYMSASDLNGFPFWGQLDWYGGGGYVVPLIARRYEDGAKLIRKMEYLEKTGWINKDTRAVFVEFGTYNPQVNLFVVVTIVAEFLPGGGVIPYYHIDPIKLLLYHTGSGLVMLISQIGFVLFTVYYTYDVISGMSKQGKKYFSEYWNMADVGNLLVAYSIIVVEVYKMVITKRILTIFTETEGTGYIKLQEALLLDEGFCYLIGFLMSLSTLKFLKLLRFNKRIGGMIATIRLCAKELKGYGVCLLITFFAFVSLFWMILGRGVREFCSFASSFESSISMMLKKFNYHDMEAASPVLAPIAFFTFALTASLVLVNILLTIIIQSFEEVKLEVQGQDRQLAEFIVRRMKLMLGRGGDRSRVVPVTFEGGVANRRDDPMDSFSGKVDKLLDFINSVYLDEQVDMEFLSKAQLSKQQLPEMEKKKKSRPRKIPRYQALHVKKQLDF